MKKLMIFSLVMLMISFAIKGDIHWGKLQSSGTNSEMTGACETRDTKANCPGEGIFTAQGCICPPKAQPVSASASAGMGDFWFWTRK